MELMHSGRVFFDPISHSYILDDEKMLMGVTELMRKHNLSPDYSGIPEATLRKAAEEGTAIHREIQDYEKGDTVFASDLIDDYKKLGLKFVEAEYPVSDYELVASAIDCVYQGTTPDSVILADIKTTQKYHRRSLEIQLGIYKVLFERQNPSLTVEACYCLWIDKKARKVNDFIPVDPMTEEEVNSLLEAEREGQIFIDENDIPSADIVLKTEELATYLANATKIAELKAAIKEVEGLMAESDARLLAYMESNNLDELAAPGGVFKRKAAYTQTRVDSAKLKEKYPSVFTAVAKEINVKGSVSFKPNKQ